ncbi:MOSC domain-containing protein [Vibrio parahaemolyticus]|uniref:MOSC domain-containing protein n=1 Tax=Vibrio parahaemolyticus TaxID=670 RepID=UPI00226AEB92|nr:MOSC N-terminal beta barrel domain-containing protein [Vibrio parahaemolyticus]MCX8948806.1 MOSC domain-containing protein [Vibrio parahaemolyticus]
MSKIVSLFSYPLKSGRGNELQEALGDQNGLYGDRHLVVLNQSDASLFSLRDNPVLSDVSISKCNKGVSITTGDTQTFIECSFDRELQAKIWSRSVAVNIASDAINDFFSDLLSAEVYLAEQHQSMVQTLMDTGPVHMVSLSDLDKLKDMCNLSDLDPMIFRPNIVVDSLDFMGGTIPDALEINGCKFTVVEATERCNAVSILHKKIHDLNASNVVSTLNRESKFNGPYFGVYLRAEKQFSMKVGDGVKALQFNLEQI